MSILLKKLPILSQTQTVCRALSSSSVLHSKQWRAEKGLCLNRTAEGILTDTPDFTYLDGRPTPLLKKQKQRMILQREIASKIVEMCSELEFAKERHHKMEVAKEKERQSILANRLKPKGEALQKKK